MVILLCEAGLSFRGLSSIPNHIVGVLLKNEMPLPLSTTMLREQKKNARPQCTQHPIQTNSHDLPICEGTKYV